MLTALRWLHLVAAATWLGGVIALGVVVVALRREGVERRVLQIAARVFGRLSWTALALAIATGIGQVVVLHMPWSYPPLHLKLGLVAATVVLTIVHVALAKSAGPALRGIMELGLLVLSLAVFWAALRI